jgi:cyanate permease
MMAAAAKKPVPAGLSEAELAIQKKRYRGVLLVSTVCVFIAFAGIYGHVTMKQPWGMPLFAVAMIAGFGAQIAFIVGLVKASRTRKGV